MNRSRIEWCDYTWNPITGCMHLCKGCKAIRHSMNFSGDIRMNKMAMKDYRVEDAPNGGGKLYILDNFMVGQTGNTLQYPFGFEPTFHRYRLNNLDNLKMGSNVFVGAMSDMFGEWVPDDWIYEVLRKCEEHPLHNYLFLTRNPTGYKRDLPIKDNYFYGITLTKEEDIPEPEDCIYPNGANMFVKVKLSGSDMNFGAHKEFLSKFKWVIIDTERSIPEREWVTKIADEAYQMDIPVYMTNALIPVVGKENIRKVYPASLTQKPVSPLIKKKLYSICCECRKEIKKREMIALLGRGCRGEQPKQYGFMCHPCFTRFCKTHDLNVPRFKGTENMDI